MMVMMIKTRSESADMKFGFFQLFYRGSVWNQNHISMISMITMETDLKTMVLVTVILSYLRRNTQIDKNR